LLLSWRYPFSLLAIVSKVTRNMSQISVILYLLAILCFTFWLRTFIPRPKRLTPEQFYGLDRKKTPVRWWLLRTCRFVFPDVVKFWVEMEELRRQEKERRRRQAK